MRAWLTLKAEKTPKRRSKAQMDKFSPETWALWADHPLNQIFRQYLKDVQTSLGVQWAAGQTMAAESQQTAKILGELSSLSFEDYARFYALEPTETESDA